MKKRAQDGAIPPITERQFRRLFDNIEDGFCLIEQVSSTPLDFQYVLTNRSFAEHTGLNAVEGKRLRELLPDVEDRVIDIYAEVVATGKTRKFEAFVADLNLWIQAEAFDPGVPDQVGVFFTNITQRKQAELELRKSEEMYRIPFNSTDEGVGLMQLISNNESKPVDLIHERKQRLRQQEYLLGLNDALRPIADPKEIQQVAMRILGEHLEVDRAIYAEINIDEDWFEILDNYTSTSVEKIVGRFPFKAFGPPGEKLKKGEYLIINNVSAEVDEYSQNAFHAIHVQAVVAVPLIKNGKLIADLSVHQTRPRHWFDHEVALLYETAERTWAAVEKAKAEKALENAQAEYRLQLEKEVRERTKELRESRDQLRSILNTTLVQMSILSAIRDDNGQITDLEIKAVNQELERETGRKDLVGKHYAKEYPGIRETGLFDLIVQAIETGESRSTEYFYPHEGFNKWFSCTFVKMDDGVVATNMDVTARKDAEAERFKNYLLLQQSEDIALLGSWEFNRLTGAFTWSDGMYRLFDLEKGREIEPEIYLEYTTAATGEAAERVVHHIRSGDSDFEETLEIRIGTSIKVLRLKATVMNSDAEEPVRVLGVDLDITALRIAEDKIRKMEVEQQRRIFETTLSTLEEERQRIAESLHNGIGQILYGIKITLAGFRSDTSADEFQEIKDHINKLLTDAIIETRRVSHELMPMTLEQFGLQSAIDDICRQLEDGTHFTCKVTGIQGRVEKYLELAIFRTVQELMNNVIKHAKASEALVTVVSDATGIHIRVTDNGRGMQATKKTKPGIGLASIRSKIKLLNGEVNVESGTGNGTTVSVHIPLMAKIPDIPNN